MRLEEWLVGLLLRIGNDLTAQPEDRLPGVRLRTGGEMLFKIGLALLALWVLGLFGVYDVGQLVHGLLLAGLMLLVLAFLHARDAALRRIGGGTNKTS